MATNKAPPPEDRERLLDDLAMGYVQAAVNALARALQRMEQHGATRAQLLQITDSKGFKQAGLPWSTVDQARWAYRTRDENGLAEAFIRINRRIHINVTKFHELIARGLK